MHRKPRKLQSYKRKTYVSNSRFNGNIWKTKTHEQHNPKHTSKITKSCCELCRSLPLKRHTKLSHWRSVPTVKQRQKSQSCPDFLDKRLRRKLRGPKSLPLLTDWMRWFVGGICWDINVTYFLLEKRVLFLPISITHSIHVPTFIPSKSQQNM